MEIGGINTHSATGRYSVINKTSDVGDNPHENKDQYSEQKKAKNAEPRNTSPDVTKHLTCWA